jgi:membrane-associated phospholipid phosphatase
MELLYWFETIRTPALDTAMSLVTRLGEETFFMVAALFVFWCVDKRRGYYLLAVGFTGTLINQWLKIVCRVPRPWVRDPHFTIVESARDGAAGYSFPSGHTQSAVGVFGGVARFTRRWWLRCVCLVLLVLVSVSRMYLGVHTPADVGVSFAVTAVLVLLLYPLIESTLWFPGRMYVILGVLLGVSGAFVAFVELFPFPADVDAANLAGAVKNAWSMAGAVGGMLLACLFDNRLLQFPNRAPWWGQLVKLLGGLVLVVLVKSLLKAPLLALCGGHQAAHALRYFLMVLTAGALWPMTFRFFERYAR